MPFQSVLVLEDSRSIHPSVAADGTVVRPVHKSNAQFEFAVWIDVGDRSVSARIEFRPAKFQSEAVGAFARAFAADCGRLILDPGQVIARRPDQDEDLAESHRPAAQQGGTPEASAPCGH